MSFEQRTHGDVTILDLTPAIVTDVSKELFQLTIESLVASGRTQVLLNLSDLRWMNSYALGLLVAAHRAVEDQGGRMALVGANERVSEMLKVVGLSQVWNVYADESTALASFGG